MKTLKSAATLIALNDAILKLNNEILSGDDAAAIESVLTARILAGVLRDELQGAADADRG